MRIIAQLPDVIYVEDHAGNVYLLPANGQSGQRVAYPATEARALRRQAD
jgi:hypothetical protein